MARKITIDRLEKAARELLCGTRSIGFCVACGSQQDHVEPDAEKYVCRSCGKMKVYGVETILLRGTFAEGVLICKATMEAVAAEN